MSRFCITRRPWRRALVGADVAATAASRAPALISRGSTWALHLPRGPAVCWDGELQALAHFLLQVRNQTFPQTSGVLLAGWGPGDGGAPRSCTVGSPRILREQDWDGESGHVRTSRPRSRAGVPSPVQDSGARAWPPVLLERLPLGQQVVRVVSELLTFLVQRDSHTIRTCDGGSVRLVQAWFSHVGGEGTSRTCDGGSVRLVQPRQGSGPCARCFPSGSFCLPTAMSARPGLYSKASLGASSVSGSQAAPRMLFPKVPACG